MKEAREHLERVLRQIKTIPNSIAYVVGGSDEMSLALLQTSHTKAVLIDSHLDFKNKVTVQLDNLAPT